MSRNDALGIIPARYASSRFPGKPLADINGKPMIQWVYERAKQARLLSDVIVATDDDRIYNAVTNFGGRAEMTSPDIRNGLPLGQHLSRYRLDKCLPLQGSGSHHSTLRPVFAGSSRRRTRSEQPRQSK